MCSFLYLSSVLVGSLGIVGKVDLALFARICLPSAARKQFDDHPKPLLSVFVP